VLPEISNWRCLCVLAVFTLVMLGKVLFVSPHEVLSDGRMDLSHQLVPWRYFGFHELKSGNLAQESCFAAWPIFIAFAGLAMIKRQGNTP